MKKIVVIGPESTGKSSLSAALAAHYGTSWCPEYARGFLEARGPAYTYEDLLLIAKGHLEMEEKNLEEARPPFYFIDTDLYVMKVWSEVVFDDCHRWILQQIAERRYDHYLLCDTDLEWEPDQLRDYPDLAMRRRLFEMYRELLIESGVSWSLVSGSQERRLQKAIDDLERHFPGASEMGMK